MTDWQYVPMRRQKQEHFRLADVGRELSDSENEALEEARQFCGKILGGEHEMNLPADPNGKASDETCQVLFS